MRYRVSKHLSSIVMRYRVSVILYLAIGNWEELCEWDFIVWECEICTCKHFCYCGGLPPMDIGEFILSAPRESLCLFVYFCLWRYESDQSRFRFLLQQIGYSSLRSKWASPYCNLKNRNPNVWLKNSKRQFDAKRHRRRPFCCICSGWWWERDCH